MKKGFTLIELLAVIVILAIIALIATPIVLRIIDNSKTSAVKRSAELYMDSVEQAIMRENLKDEFSPSTCTIQSNGNLLCDDTELEIEMSGEKPSGGTITLEDGKITGVQDMTLGGYVLETDSKGNIVIKGMSNEEDEYLKNDDTIDIKLKVISPEEKILLPGDEVVFEIIWRNYKEEASDIKVTFDYDYHISDYVSCTGDCTYDSNSHTATWNLGKQDSNKKGKVTITTKIVDSGVWFGYYEVSANITVGSDEPIEADPIDLTIPYFELMETDPGAGMQVFPEDEIYYDLVWANYKNENSTIVIKDILDPGLDFVSASENGVYDSETHTVTWTITNQTPGDEPVLQLTVMVNDKIYENDRVINQAIMKIDDDVELKAFIIANPLTPF